ncbi:MAG: hypothetical protein IJ323_06360 [Clostridia bacterium]|nr:hypothetical protein [Clostridia bacterium]
MSRRKIRLSKISLLHYYKLLFRSALFIICTVLYILSKLNNNPHPFSEIQERPAILGFIWIVFTFEMILRFFPSRLESMGCQKQFKKNFVNPKTYKSTPDVRKSTFAVALSWLLLNGIIGLLYYIGFIDKGILILISLFYSVCDMICILFFCPFQTWFMKNKCCGSCRIYNWDYAMMCTPLIFIPDVFTWSLLLIALLLLIFWETLYHLHPERFHEETNDTLSCRNCEEKLCQHKKCLRHL